MPRTARLLIDGAIYHVLTRGNNGQPVFHQEYDYQKYMQMLETQMSEHKIKLFHFALMPNHVHLLVQPSSGQALSRAMFGISLCYARLFQRRYQYTGHVWQGRFRSLPISNQTSLLECGRYIELHPVQGGLAQEPGAYPWSSYNTYALGAESSLVTPDPIYQSMGRSPAERQAAYRQFVQEGVKEQRTLSGSTEHQVFSAMLKDLEKRFGTGMPGAKRGRPRKAQVADPLPKLGTALFLGVLSAKSLDHARSGRARLGVHGNKPGCP